MLSNKDEENFTRKKFHALSLKIATAFDEHITCFSLTAIDTRNFMFLKITGSVVVNQSLVSLEYLHSN